MGKTIKHELLNDFRLISAKLKSRFKQKTRNKNKGIRIENKMRVTNLEGSIEKFKGRNESEWEI